MSVIIDSSLHLFRSESELKNEAKGGYLKGKIILPSSAIGSDLELALYDTNGLTHPNKLFITPLNKRQNNTEKYVTPLVTDRNLKLLYQNNNYVVDTKNHPYLSRLVENREQIVGAGFFDHQNNQFYLGLSGLKLTVMNDIKKGKKSALEYSKVKLGMKVLNDPEKTYFSSIIQDSKYYDLKLEEVDRKEDLVTVTFKKGNGQLIKSMISKMSLKMAIGDQQILSEDHDIKSQKEVQFKNVEKRFDHPLSKENILVEIEYKDKSNQIVKVKDLKRKITDTSNNPDEPKKMNMDYGNSLESQEGMLKWLSKLFVAYLLFIKSYLYLISDQVNSLKLENSQLKKEIHELKTRLEIQEQENLHLRNENIDKLKSKQESVEKENHELKTRLEILEQENLHLRNENAILQDQQRSIGQVNDQLRTDAVIERVTTDYESSSTNNFIDNLENNPSRSNLLLAEAASPISISNISDIMNLIDPDVIYNESQFDGGDTENESEDQNLDYDPVHDKSIGVVTFNHETPKEVLKKVNNNNKPMLVKVNECKEKPIIVWSENGVGLKLDTWSVIDSIRKEMKSMECTPKNGILSKDNFLLLMISKNWRTFYQLHKNLMSQWMINCFFHTVKKNERIFMMELRNRKLPFKK